MKATPFPVPSSADGNKLIPETGSNRIAASAQIKKIVLRMPINEIMGKPAILQLTGEASKSFFLLKGKAIAEMEEQMKVRNTATTPTIIEKAGT